MTDFETTFPWLKNNLAQLINYKKQKRIPQALLISGKQGLGKYQLARYFAHLLLCTSNNTEEKPCGICSGCRLFAAKTHPDFITLQPQQSGKTIGIDAIRQLIERLVLKPQFDGYRIVIIDPADQLNESSANAFLKCLEEPTERSCLFLISDNPGKLKATIRSRCQHLRIAMPERKLLNDWLEKQGITENKDLLINLSQGSPLVAQQISNQDLLEFRKTCFVSWIKVARSTSDALTLAEQWYKIENTELELLMFWIKSWLVDMVKLAYTQENKNLYNPDFTNDLQVLVQKLNLKSLYQYYDFILQCQQRLNTQLNKQLIFEEILIQWSELNHR